MGFKQTFSNVKSVKNLDDVSLCEGRGESGLSFEQNYRDVLDVINLQYDGSHLAIVNSLVEQIMKMDEKGMDRFAEGICLHTSAESEREFVEYQKLEHAISQKEDKRAAILEYIKAGTTSMSFATSLLTLLKNILS